MCLEVTVLLPRGVQPRVEPSDVAVTSGLHVTLFRTDDGRAAFRFSGTGGCSCDLLPEDPGAKSPSWKLETNRPPQVAEAVAAIAKRNPAFSFRATWLGIDSVAPASASVSLPDLKRVIATNAIGNGIEYVVGAA